MASFQEKITILIETKVDSAKSQLSGLKQSISDAEGATGKLKAAAGGMGSAIESAAGAFLSPAGLAAGAAAVGGAAIKAVSQFENLGLAIGKLRDGTGLSAEAASRWVEVADDAGISTESFTKSVGFLEKAIGTNKEAFTQWGVEIAKNADGTTDMNQTLLNAIGVLNGIEDPVKRNAAGLALFGRNWKDMSELIVRGADGVKKSLDAVQSTKVFSDKDINTSRDVRDGFDAIHDAVDGLFLSMGKALAPAVATVATKLGELITKAEPAFQAMGQGLADTADAAGPVIDAIGAIADGIGKLQGIKLDFGLPDVKGFQPFAGGITQVGEALDLLDKALGGGKPSPMWDDVFGHNPDADNAKNAATNTDKHAAAVAALAASTDEAAAAADKAAADTASWNKALDSMNKFLDNLAKGFQGYLDATAGQDWGASSLNGAVTAMSAFTTQHNALIDINADSQKAVDDFTESIKKNGKSFDVTTQKGRDNQSALEDVAKTLDTKLAAAYTDAHGNMDVFKTKSQAISDDAINALMPALKGSGITAEDLAKKLGLLPEDIETRYKMSGDEEAKVKIGLLQTAIDNLPKDVQATVTQQIIAGDYQGALATVQNYYDRNPADVQTNVAPPQNAEMAHIADLVSAYYAAHPVNVKLTPLVGKFAGGGKVGPEGGIGGEAGAEFIETPDGKRYLITGPTALAAGTKVTSTRQTRSILARKPKMYANGTSQPAVVTAAGAPMTFQYIQQAPVYGVDDLNRHLEAWSQQLAQQISVGRRS